MLTKLKKLSKTKKRLFHRVGENGNTTLHRALQCNRIDISELVIRESASVYDVGKYGETLLHLAVLNSYQDIVILLINNKAIATNENRDTSLHLAAFYAR